LSDGGCDFPIDPALPADRAAIVWLPHLDPAAVLVAPAPEAFREAQSLGSMTPAFTRSATDGDYWLVDDRHSRLPALLIGGAQAATRAAVVIPLDADFVTRADAALRLWRLVAGRSSRRAPDRLTAQRRYRLTLTLRTLDARLNGESYRVIAQTLFGRAHIPVGAGWKTHELRDRTIRLARAGLKLMRAGYLKLLRHRRSRLE